MGQAAAAYVEEAVVSQTEDVTVQVEEIKESVEKKVEQIAAAENGAGAAPIENEEAEKAAEKVEEKVKEKVEEKADEKAQGKAEEKADEKTEEKMEEKEKAMECKAPGAPLIVVLEVNGSRKTVEFTYKPLGFEHTKPKGCCVPTRSPKAVRVTKVAAKQQP